MDFQSLATLAEELARAAGNALLERRPHLLDIQTKSSRTDFVTEMDLLSESIIKTGLMQRRPHDQITGEEGTAVAGTSGVTWLVDPIDGTTNYVRGIPHYSVSIGAYLDQRPCIGVVYDPTADEMFSSIAGRGARLNGSEITTQASMMMEESILATGFGYTQDRRQRQGSVLAALLPMVADIRRPGSAALNLCWLAAGRIDGYYEEGLQPWDYAAGVLIAREAGARVEDLDGGEPTNYLIAAPANMFLELKSAIAATIGHQ